MNLLGSKSMELIPAQYNAPLPEAVTDEITTNLVSYHLDNLTEAGWFAGRVYADCVALRDLPALRDYDPDVLDLTATDQYHLRQIRALFAKRSDYGDGVGCESAALRTFEEAERACKLTNDCFRAWHQGRFQFRPDVESVLHGAQRKIAELFADPPSLDEIRPRFGPGANTQVPKRHASLWRKLHKVPACSREAAGEASELLNSFTTYAADGESVKLEIVPGKLAFVPKNAKTKRITVTEPTLNGVWQLGLGDYMARVLRRVGIDIRDQSANQRAALYGSISNVSATIDMKSASDTIATGLIDHLWSDAWSQCFRLLRTSLIALPEEHGGNIAELNKISSMGNGFTFPLETAVFWALAQAAKDLWAPRDRTRVLVYGDDIVIPASIADRFMRVLEAIGFTPNSAKSFVDGTFRESCGCDYVLGTNVRPYYIKGHNERGDPVGPHGLKVSDLFIIHNAYVARRQFVVARAVAKLIPRVVRLRGPSGFGDGHLHDAVYVAKRASPRKGWEGYTFETWGSAPRVGRIVYKTVVEKAVKLSVTRGLDGLYSAKSVRAERRVYPASTYWHAIRVATYAAYRAEDALPDGGSMAIKSLRSPSFLGLSKALDSLFPRTPSDGEAPFVVPGVGSVRRTKVYTFEPPRLQL